MRNFLIYFAIKYSGDFDKIYQAIINKELVEQKDIEQIKRSNISAVTILDLEYPNSLKTCYKPPFVLFYKGDISLLNSESIAVVGSRYPSEYAIKATSSQISIKTPFVK